MFKASMRWFAGLSLLVSTVAATVHAQAISTFPYAPTSTQMASDFSVNAGSGPTPGGSAFAHGALSGNRHGTTGSSCSAWACQPSANYAANTTTWLLSPAFDLTGQGAMEARFDMWIRAQNRRDGMKLQVSTNGGSSWSDITTMSVPYNGTTSMSGLLASKFGGGDGCWNGHKMGQNKVTTVRVPLHAYKNCSNLRLRWCFVCDGVGHDQGPVIDSFSLLSSATASPALFQGTSSVAVVIEGEGFIGATDVLGSTGITVNSFNVDSDTQISANVDVAQLADAGFQAWTVETTGDPISVQAYITYPTDILPTTDDTEPARNPAVGGVNVFWANGEFFRAETDLSTRGRMMGIHWSRFYSSNNIYNGPMGFGWMGYYYQRAIFDDVSEDITWYTPDGRTELFAWNSGNSNWDSPAGIYIQAVYDPGAAEVILTDRHGFVCTFNAEGRLESCTDRNGNPTTCTYNADGQLEEVTDDRGFHYAVAYYAHGRVQTVSDYVWHASSPRVIEYVYDTDGDLVTFKAPETERYRDSTSNRTKFEYTYDSDHRLLTCKNPREVQSSGDPYLVNTYDSTGRVIEQRLGTTNQKIYLRYVNSTTRREVDRRALRTDYTIDGTGRTTAVERFNHYWSVDTTDPIDHTTITKTSSNDIRGNSSTLSWATALTYNSNHEVTSVTYPRGNSVEYAYDTGNGHLSSGNVLTVTRKDNSLGSEADIVTTYTYDTELFNVVETVTDPNNEETNYAYDENGNLTSVTSPTIEAYTGTFTTTTYQIVQSYTYNEYGQVESATDGEGNVTTYEYNDGISDPNQEGFLQKIIVDDGDLELTTEYQYNRAGMTIATWSPRGFEGGATKDDFKTEYSVNQLGQTWRVIGRKLFNSGSQRSQSFSYFDLNGNVTQRFVAYITADGDTPSTPNEGTVEVTPSSLTKSVGGMAATWIETTYVYNLLNSAVEVTQDAVADGIQVIRYTTEYVYDANYNQIRTLTPLSIEHETLLDERELVFKRVAASGEGSGIEGTFRSDYDDNGNVVSSFDALNNQTTFLYDGFDRQIKVTDPAGHYRTTAYDSRSNVTESKAYNSGNTLLARTAYTYDEASRVVLTSRLAEKHTSANIGDGEAKHFVALDRNSRAFVTKDDNGVRFFTFYDGANRVTSTVDNVGNEVEYDLNAEGAAFKTTYREYNSITTGTEVSHSEVDFDPPGRTVAYRDQRYNMSTRNTEVKYFLDSMGRAVRVMDAGGNITRNEYDLRSLVTKSLRYPNPSSPPYWNPASDTVMTTFSYDAEGRNTQRIIWGDPMTPANPQITEYDFDARGRLIKLTRPDNDEWDFSYNAQNRTGWEDPMGTVVADTYDSRNLVTLREITRGTGVGGVTKETYAYDGLGRLTTGINYENISSSDVKHTETSWQYNTLSMPERHDQWMQDSWGKYRSFTSYAGFDATGFNTSHTYANSRSVLYTPDSLNRLSNIEDDTNSIANLATFSYAGAGRLIRRVYDNGVTMNVAYEASGCGCGGFSGFIESVQHTGPSGLLFREERRFDVVGNPTSVRWGHLGGVGEVYRYDGSHRLVEVYEGLGVQGSGIDTFANPAQAVNVAFKLVRDYNFDTKSNRTSVTMADDNSDPITTDSYSPDADTNVYNQVNSQSYQFDTVENQTFDPTTGLYKRYDYLNRLIAEYGSSGDMENDLALKRYRYDVHNRMRVEETNYPVEDTETNAFTAFYECFANCPGGSGGCGGNPGLIYASELRVNEADEPMRSVEYTIGVGITGSMSGNVGNPWVATRLPGGPNNNKSLVLVEVAHDHGGSFLTPPPGVWRFRHENQQRSLIGMTDLDGLPTAEVDYNEYGLAYLKDVLWVPGAGSLAEASADEAEPWGDVAVLEVDVGLLEADLVGAMARVVNPTTAPHVVTGRIVAHVAGTPDEVYIEDPDGDFLSAINAGGIVTVFAHYDAILNGSQVHTSGRWTTAPAHSAGTTTFTASGSVFEDYMVGWQIQPDARYPVFFEITGVDGAELTVRGDLESQIPNLESEAVHYILIPPVGIDRATGAIDASFASPTSRYLAFSYHYIPPVAGVSVNDTTVGAQAGTNLTGLHYCWNRFYQANTGRWITDDPVESELTQLDYVGSAPAAGTDPSGLQRPFPPARFGGPNPSHISFTSYDQPRLAGFYNIHVFSGKPGSILVQTVSMDIDITVNSELYERSETRYAEWFRLGRNGQSDEDHHYGAAPDPAVIANFYGNPGPPFGCNRVAETIRFSLSRHFVISKGYLSGQTRDLHAGSGNGFGYLNSWIGKDGDEQFSRTATWRWCPSRVLAGPPQQIHYERVPYKTAQAGSGSFLGNVSYSLSERYTIEWRRMPGGRWMTVFELYTNSGGYARKPSSGP